MDIAAKIKTSSRIITSMLGKYFQDDLIVFPEQSETHLVYVVEDEVCENVATINLDRNTNEVSWDGDDLPPALRGEIEQALKSALTQT